MNRNLLVLPLLAFFVNLGFGAISPIIPFYLISLEGGLNEIPEALGRIEAKEYAVQFGVLMAAFMATRAFLAPYFGKLSDDVGRKKIITVGLSLYGVVSFVYLLAENWIHLALIRALQGVASAMVWPVAEALLMDTVRFDVRGVSMGWYMTLSNAGFMIGPAVGAYVYKFGVLVLNLSVPDVFRFPFLVLALLSTLALILAIFIKEIPLEELQRLATDGGSEEPISGELKTTLKAIYVMALANGFAMGFIVPVVSLFIIEYVSSDPAVLGVLSTVASVVGFFVSIPAGRVSDIKGRKPLIVVGQLISRVATIVMPFVRTVDGLLAVYCLRSVAFNMSSPPFRALQGDIVPPKIRGRIFGTVQAFFNFGAILGPLLGPAFYGVVGPHVYDLFGFKIEGIVIPFWVSAALGIFSLAVFVKFVKEPEKKL